MRPRAIADEWRDVDPRAALLPLQHSPRSANPARPVLWKLYSQSRFSGFARSNTDRRTQITYEDLPIADASRFRRARNGLNDPRHLIIGHRHFDLDLGHELNGVFGSPVRFLVAFLTPEPFNFRDGHALHADFKQGVLHFIQFKRLNDRFDKFH